MKNDRISRLAKQFKERFQSLAAKFKHSEKPKRTSDFASHSRSETVVLRERTLHIEFSRSKAKRFARRHKTGLITGFAVLFAIIITRYVLVGFASIADFYPSSCLGNWNNVQNALGKPNVYPGAPVSAFTTLNSALFGTSTAQMFCGNFSGDTDIETLMSKSFQSADIVLSWSFAFPSVPTMPSSGGGGGGGNGAGVISTPALSTDSGTSSSSENGLASSTTSSTLQIPDGSIIAPVSTDEGGGDSSDTIASSSDNGTVSSSSAPTDIEASSTDASSSASSSAPSESTTTIVSSPATSSATSSDQIQVAPVEPSSTNPTPSSTPDNSNNPPSPPAQIQSSTPPSDTSSDSDNSVTPPAASQPASSSSQSSWLMKFVDVAYADETSSVALAASTSEIADSSTMLTMSSSAEQGIPTEPEPSPININTSMFQNIILPSSTTNDFLAVVYSTDGVTWQPLVNINSSNWQQSRFPIPIHSWQELQHLQVAFVGLGASSSPQIFLDAAGVEVSYLDTPEGVTDVTSSTDQGDVTNGNLEVGTPATSSWTPPSPAAIIQKPTISEADVFQQDAHQQCVVAPFSGTVSPGNSTSLSLELFSGIKSSSTRAQYQTQVGSLPVGITATITDGKLTNVSSTQSIHISASASAPDGSYSILVIYRERQDDGSMRSTGCQMNIVVQ